MKRLWQLELILPPHHGRIMIDFIDPLIVAERIATTENTKYLTIRDIKDELRDGEDGVSRSWCNGEKNNERIKRHEKVYLMSSFGSFIIGKSIICPSFAEATCGNISFASNTYFCTDSSGQKCVKSNPFTPASFAMVPA